MSLCITLKPGNLSTTGQARYVGTDSYLFKTPLKHFLSVNIVVYCTEVKSGVIRVLFLRCKT